MLLESYQGKPCYHCWDSPRGARSGGGPAEGQDRGQDCLRAGCDQRRGMECPRLGTSIGRGCGGLEQDVTDDGRRATG